MSHWNEHGAAFLALSTALAGCGSADPPFQPASHAPLPTVSYHGGELLRAVDVVVVTFANDPDPSRDESFAKELIHSPYWHAVTSEYCDGQGRCIGDGASAKHVALPDPIMGSFYPSEFTNKFLDPRILDGTLPMPTPETLYLFYLPPGASAGDASTAGYHERQLIQLEDGSIVTAYYAVVNENAGDEAMTAAHEIIESASDPSPYEGFAVDDAAWAEHFDAEVSDLCGNDFPLQVDGQKVGRSWSNASAAAGHNPCVPVPEGEVYFNAAPETQALHLGVGESATVKVVAFSDGPGDGWSLSVEDDTHDQQGQPVLQVSIDPENVSNGTTATVTVKLLRQPTSLSGNAIFSVVSHRNVQREWPVLVIPR